jgi:hypothetical protein
MRGIGTVASETQRLKVRDTVEKSPFVAPQKERGLWNFLTWSFFLSLVLSSEFSADGASAHAAAADTSVAQSHEGDGAASTASLAAPAAVAASGEEAVAASGEQHANESSAGVVAHGGQPRQFSGPEHISLEHHQAGAAGSAGSGYVDVSIGDIMTDVGSTVSNVGDGLTGLVGGVLHPVTETLQSVVSSLDGIVDEALSPLLETTAGITHLLDNVFGPGTDGAAHTIGDVAHVALAPVTSVVDGVVTPLISSFAPVPDVVGSGLSGLLGHPGSEHDAVASAGSITLPVTSSLGGVVDDLFSAGRYSDYNLELQTGVSASAGAPVATSSAGSVLANLFSGDAGSVDHPNDHAASSHPLALPNALDELGSRLHDGIV